MNGHSHASTVNNGSAIHPNGPLPSTSQQGVNPAGMTTNHLASNGRSATPLAAPSVGLSTPAQSSFAGPAFNTQDAARDSELAAYLLSEGFSNGRFSDCSLDFHIANSTRVVYMLHKIILARSPVLAAYLEQIEGRDLALYIPDENVTQESLLIVLGYLYSTQARYRIQPHNAKAVLAAAAFLGQQDLADQAAELCRQTITHVSEPAQVLDWIRFLDAPASGAPALMDNGSRSNTPQQQQSLYGPHTATLRQTLMHHLTHVLPVSMCAFATKHSQSSSATGGSPVVPSQASSAASQEAQQQLSAIYSLLPFNLFKVIVESPQFPPGDMERFAFAKRCITERKKVQGAMAASESAVLAFGNTAGQDKASNVEVISKNRRGRQFWKVGEASG